MIRIYRDADRQAVIELVLGIQNNEFGLHLSIDDQRDLLDVPGYYLEAGGGFWVAVSGDGEVIGTIGLLRLNDSTAVMKKFFVAARHRGRQHGHSQQLFAEFLSFARSQQIRQIVLDTPAAATRSHQFYRSAGFREIPRSALPVRYDFPERDTLFFSLQL